MAALGKTPLGAGPIAEQSFAPASPAAPDTRGLQAFSGTFVINAAPGQQTIETPGIRGKAALFFAQENPKPSAMSELRKSFGAATSGTDRWAAISSHRIGAAMTSSQFRSDRIVQFNSTIDHAPVVSIDFVAFTDNGFIVDVKNTNVVNVRSVAFMVLGGDDIEAHAGVFTSPTSVQQQTILDIPFKPKASLFAWAAKDADEAPRVGARLGLGWTLGPAQQVAQSYTVKEASLPSVVNQAQIADGCLIGVLNGFGKDEEIRLVSFDANRFTVNWFRKTATAFKVGYLALGGKAQIAMGRIVEPNTLGSQFFTTGFAPLGTLFMNSGAPSASFMFGDAIPAIGFATATHQIALSSLSLSASSSTTLPSNTTRDGKAILRSNITDDSTIAEATYFTNADPTGFGMDWTKIDLLSVETLFLSIGAAPVVAVPDPDLPNPIFCSTVLI